MTARLDIEDFFSVMDPNLINCASNTFELSRAKVSTVYLTAAKLKLQRTCFPVMCPRLDENDGIFQQKLYRRSPYEIDNFNETLKILRNTLYKCKTIGF